MSLTMTRTDRVTVLTLTSDPDSRWPPVCQILKSICYSPVCCSVSQQLRTVQGMSLSILGALQIMIGLLNIGLGILLLLVYSHYWFLISHTGFPFWLGSLFIVFGIVSILSEKYPSPCLVIINVILNLAGVGFAIAAIVLYSNYIAYVHPWYNCEESDEWVYSTRSPASDMDFIKDNCLEAKALVVTLLKSIAGVLIVLAAVQLCVTFSSAVLGIKALRRTNKKNNKSCEDPEQYKPLLEEIPPKSAA